jgi:hypothetical protein
MQHTKKNLIEMVENGQNKSQSLRCIDPVCFILDNFFDQNVRNPY